MEHHLGSPFKRRVTFLGLFQASCFATPGFQVKLYGPKYLSASFLDPFEVPSSMDGA